MAAQSQGLSGLNCLGLLVQLLLNLAIHPGSNSRSEKRAWQPNGVCTSACMATSLTLQAGCGACATLVICTHHPAGCTLLLQRCPSTIDSQDKTCRVCSQVTWIGYPNSTGLEGVHYRITDAICDPPTTSQTFAETLWRLPGCFLCYTPPPELPPVGPVPAAQNGFLTFGSFNALAKVTPQVLRCPCKQSLPSLF